MTESQLIEGCKKHDSKALKLLYEQYAGRMLSVCRRYVSDIETARDLMHDGFVLVFENIADYRGDGSFEGWLRRIFVNTVLSYLRKNDVLSNSMEIELQYDLSSKELSIIEKMEINELLECIAQLPTGYRTVLNLYSIEGYSHKEIAERLGITEETSRSQLFRAKAMLQKMMKKWLD